MHRSRRPVPNGGDMLVNSMPRYEILSDEAMAVLDSGWRRLVSEVGIEFHSDEALELFRAAGQRVEGRLVRSTRISWSSKWRRPRPSSTSRREAPSGRFT